MFSDYCKNPWSFMENLTSLWLNYLMTAIIIFRNKAYEVKNGMTIRKALQKLNIEPDSVLATRDGELVTDDEIIQKNDYPSSGSYLKYDKYIAYLFYFLAFCPRFFK
jgi:sulfur carrier protein ThiS